MSSSSSAHEKITDHSNKAHDKTHDQNKHLTGHSGTASTRNAKLEAHEHTTTRRKPDAENHIKQHAPTNTHTKDAHQ
ncbi:unnamed protein product, partial [Rotaria sp. Silwood1]